MTFEEQAEAIRDIPLVEKSTKQMRDMKTLADQGDQLAKREFDFALTQLKKMARGIKNPITGEIEKNVFSAAVLKNIGESF